MREEKGEEGVVSSDLGINPRFLIFQSMAFPTLPLSVPALFSVVGIAFTSDILVDYIKIPK